MQKIDKMIFKIFRDFLDTAEESLNPIFYVNRS